MNKRWGLLRSFTIFAPHEILLSESSLREEYGGRDM